MFALRRFLHRFSFHSNSQVKCCRGYTSANNVTALVTGANAGMGFYTAMNLARTSAKVILGCRNMRAGHEAVHKIRKQTNNREIVAYELDLASFSSINNFANKVKECDILINNAGVFMLPLRRTSDKIEMHLGVNFLGHYYLTTLLLDKLKQSHSARIINIASTVPPFQAIKFDDINSEKSYNRIRAVIQSKQAVLLYTKYLASKLEGTHVTVNSVDPGLVLNEFGRNRDYWYGYFQLFFYPLLKIMLKSPAQGCQSAVYCAISDDMIGVTGKHVVNQKVSEIPLPISLDEAAAKKLDEISRSLILDKRMNK